MELIVIGVVVVLIALILGYKVKYKGLEITKSSVKADRALWDSVVMAGFMRVVRVYFGVLKNFMERDLSRFYVQAFIALLKERGVAHQGIRHHKDVIAYETIMGMSFRKVVIPQLMLNYFQNHIPKKSDLSSDSPAVRQAAEDWYRSKYNDVWGDSINYCAKNWPITSVSHAEATDNYRADMENAIFPALVNMFESIRTKRAAIFVDMEKDHKNLDLDAVGKRWEELFLLMGYIDILEG